MDENILLFHSDSSARVLLPTFSTCEGGHINFLVWAGTAGYFGVDAEKYDAGERWV